MGLGLHIASDVAARHGLRLDLTDTEGGGLTVVLRFGQRDT
jgi:signal transduction histidine kinase